VGGLNREGAGSAHGVHQIHPGRVAGSQQDCGGQVFADGRGNGFPAPAPAVKQFPGRIQ